MLFNYYVKSINNSNNKIFKMNRGEISPGARVSVALALVHLASPEGAQ
jgi:hypothetical protein